MLRTSMRMEDGSMKTVKKGDGQARAMFVLMIHELTNEQSKEAIEKYGVTEFIELPKKLRIDWLWIPADADSLIDFLYPFRQWLFRGRIGDYVLIHGEPGAAHLMINCAVNGGMIPIYATTERGGILELQEGGTIKKTTVFRHIRFRRYENVTSIFK